MIEQLYKAIEVIEHEWAAKRLLVVGDLMLDKYIWGEVARISPEAPVPVVHAIRQSEQPGGAANVAMNLARLGAQVVVAGFAGDDENQQLLDTALRADGIVPEFVICEGFPTITKLRILGGNQQMLRLDSERLAVPAQENHDHLVERVLKLLPGSDAMVLSDYAKGALTPAVCQQLIRAARRLEIPVLVDPKSADLSRYRGATTVCPNRSELAAALREDAHDLEALLAAADSLPSILDIEFLTATLGDKGIALLRPGSQFLAPAVARQVFDVSGAGDTVIAVLALCLASQLKPETAVQLANVAAGIVVGKPGTVPIEKHELLVALAPRIEFRAEAKLATRPALVSRVAQWKANGDRVVFTNGCFDLLHIGHITLLEQARRFGDRLIVAVNGDASVRKLKGPSRPIVGERERARLMAALSAVDAVVIFAESTPLELILAIRPDVIVKGGDYGLDTVVGAREVQSWGGQVKIVPLVEGFSTSRLIERSTGEFASA
ncbi:MAG: D-glycero-beta-D-manno-heptose-7-phosphate kinase [Terracidiphilus sp.]|jgi:D-beta-D-heptose 7-phosphate kinase/D-beta-D-heptose 1-phosphate adenosyltransferase